MSATFTAPKVHDVLPGFVPMNTRRVALLTCDPDFLAIVDPAQYLMVLQQLHAMHRVASAYSTTRSTANGVKHLAYSEGAVKAPKRETLMDRYSRQAHALGIHA